VKSQVVDDENDDSCSDSPSKSYLVGHDLIHFVTPLLSLGNSIVLLRALSPESRADRP
jgi:hypothetical protein